MKVLVTAFEPFGGETINPALESLKRISYTKNSTTLITLEVPTVFYDSIQVVTEAINSEKPDVVICIGQAGGRFKICPERVAINIDDARIPDNKQQQPIDKPIKTNGANAYFTTLPVKAICEALNEEGIPSELSNTAGTFVCNHLFYGVMHYIAEHKLSIKAGFIHIPYVLEQVVNKKNMPAFSLETLIRGIETAIDVAVTRDTDKPIVGGALD